MSEIDHKIIELEARLESLVRGQIEFQVEVTAIRNELSRLRRIATPSSSQTTETHPPPQYQQPEQQHRPQPLPCPEPSPRPAQPPASFGYSTEQSSRPEDKFNEFFAKHTESARADLEKFIGENLISKIGILILIIGIGIGVKYSIDNELISPLTRVILGYVFGFGLVGLALKLKPKYHNFSAVLMSGGMAVMYFVTYFAYSLYELIPQLTAFALMAMFTFLAVGTAIFYNRQIIAHIGLVGAYAVPFLLSNNSGNYLFLFIYMAMLNAGILIISLKKDWRPLFYTASAFTWIIFGGWFASKFAPAEHFYLAIVFLGVFFAIFYAIRLMPLVSKGQEETVEDKVSIATTAGIFYLFCLAISGSIIAAEQHWLMFSCLAVSAVAILLTSYNTIGKWLIYLVYPATWFTFLVWFLDQYDPSIHFQLAAIFAIVYFAIFYVATLAYRLLRDDFNLVENAGCLLTNAFLYYGIGYHILDSNAATVNFLGIYTVGHGLLHLGVAHFVNRLKPAVDDVVQVLTILILTFGTIAIPVQFDGNFVTMAWAVEAAVLFWMGRSRGLKFFEYFSYPVMLLAAVSMLADWAVAIRDTRPPIVNGDLVTALVMAGAFAFIFFVNQKEDAEPAIPSDLLRPFGYFAASVAVFVFYNAFRIEIGNYYEAQKALAGGSDSIRLFPDLHYLNYIWQVNYTLFFLSAMGIVNQLRVRSRSVALVNSILAVGTLAVFATFVMFYFSELRILLQRTGGGISGQTNIAIRYVSYVFAAGMLYVLYRYIRDELLEKWIPSNVLQLAFEAVFYTFLFIVGSCELVNLMGQFHIADATKLGLSILWGVYALTLIVLGIAWDKKHLRVAAIVLLGVTLAKLFFYDITELGTIPKTILFVTLGITLLVISFLYNKYKNIIFPAPAMPTPEPTEGSVTDL